MKENGLGDNYVREVLGGILKGFAIPLGSKIYKIRAARHGAGKRSGFRNIFFWKKEIVIIFCALFGKNEQDDLSEKERLALRIWSNDYDRLTDDEIKTALANDIFKEIAYES